MRAAIYARKSTDQPGVADEVKSVARQVEHATAYAVGHGWTVAEAHIYVDDGISGAEFAKRPGFVRLMNALTPAPPFEVLIVSELSRLGREQLETGYALKQVAQAGVRVWSYLEDREVVLDTATDKFLMSAVTFAAEMEREKARQRTHDALRRKAAAGHVTGGRVFGYDNVRVDGHVVRRINDAEAAVIQRIFTRCAAGRGMKPIAKALNREGAPSPRAQQGRPHGWAPSSIREVLYRPLYRGEVIWNKTKKRDAWGRARVQRRPEAEWLLVELPELRIVDEACWKAAHARLARARKHYLRGTNGRLWGRPVGGGESKYLLPGLARCGVCGGGLYVKSRSHGRRRAYFYGCTAHHKRGSTVCPNSGEIPMPRADATVLEAVLADFLDADVIEAVVTRALDQRRPAAAAARTRIERALADLDQEIMRLSDAIAAGGELAGLVRALAAREDRRQVLQTELASLGRIAHVGTVDRETLATAIRQRVEEWRGLLTRQTSHARQLLRKLVDGPMIFTPTSEDPAVWEFRATGRVDRLLAGIVDATSVASPRGVLPFTCGVP